MPYYGEIKILAHSTFPPGFVLADGSPMNVSGNEQLANLLLSSLFGLGTSNAQFVLPDLRSRTLVHNALGTDHVGGVETVTLATGNLPSHTHATGAHATATGVSPSGAVLAGGGVSTAFATAPIEAAYDNSMLATTGGDGAHSNIQPYLALNLLICVSGGL